MAEQKNGKPFVTGAVIGAVLGAATALLLAPKSGRELRKDIADQTNQLAGKTQELAGNFTQSAQGVARSIGSTTSDWVEKAKEVALSVADEMKAWKASRGQSEAGTASVSAATLAQVEQHSDTEEAEEASEASAEREIVSMK